MPVLLARLADARARAHAVGARKRSTAKAAPRACLVSDAGGREEGYGGPHATGGGREAGVKM